MTKLLEDVKTFLKKPVKKNNPYYHYKNDIGNNVRHPQQPAKACTGDIIFRRVPHDVINTFDKYLQLSEIGVLFDKYPHLLRVMNYVKYRSTTYTREGFLLRHMHVVDGTDKIRPFSGNEKTFYKYLYLLEYLGIVILDKRFYGNYVWINYDIMGQYPIDSIHSNTEFTDEFLENFKNKYRIYRLSALDHKAKLEVLWNYQIGYRSHYDMFDNDMFHSYTKNFNHIEDFDSGIKEVNEYDYTLRVNAFDSRRTKIMANQQRSIVLHRLPQYKFEYGGEIMVAKLKSLEEQFEKLRVNADGTLDVDSFKKENVVKKVVEGKKKPIEKTSVKKIDWTTADIANIKWNEVDNRAKHAFKRGIVSHLDDLFVEGLNKSKQVQARGGLGYSKFISDTAPTDNEAKSIYYGNVNSIFKNIYERMVNENFTSERMRQFVKWAGRYYVDIFNTFTWYEGTVEPNWYFLSKSPDITKKNNGIFIANHFFNEFKKVIKNKQKDEVINNHVKAVQVSTVKAPNKVDNDELLKLKRIILKERKEREEILAAKIEEEKQRLQAKDRAAKMMREKQMETIMKNAQRLGIDPMELIVE